MAEYRKTEQVLLAVALVLFALSYLMLVLSGANPFIAFVWNLLSSMDVGLTILPAGISAGPLPFIASILDAFIFALMTVVIAALFFNFIKQINLTKRIVLSRIRKIRQHIIIVPYNQFAHSLDRELRAIGEKTVVVTTSEADARKMYRRGELAIVADPKNIESFYASGIGRAKFVIACDDDDVENALISITAKSANPKAKIISRISNLDNIAKLKNAGAQRMIMPEVSTGIEMGNEIVKRI
jgi:voltage-gated potassium channel